MHRQCPLWGSQASVPHGEQSHPAESHPGKSPQLLPSPQKPLLGSYSTCTFFLPQRKPPDAYFSPPPCSIQVQTTQLPTHCPTVPNFAAAWAQPPEELFGEPCQSPPGNRPPSGEARVSKQPLARPWGCLIVSSGGLVRPTPSMLGSAQDTACSGGTPLVPALPAYGCSCRAVGHCHRSQGHSSRSGARWCGAGSRGRCLLGGRSR